MDTRGERSTNVVLLALAVTIVVLVVAVVLLLLQDNRSQPWAGLAYELPLAVIEKDNSIPTVDGVDIPSFPDTDGTLVPLRLTRITDCDHFECPAGELPYTIDVRWQRLEGGVEKVTQVELLSAFNASLVEGIDYIRGERGSYTSQLNPIPVPDGVREYAAETGAEVTSWRIEGIVQPLVVDADPIPWSSQVFNVYHGEAGDG